MKAAVLALQGAFIEHEQVLQRLGVETVEIRQLKDWAEFMQQAHLHSTLATGQDECIPPTLLPIAKLANLDCIDTQLLQHLLVLNECSLQS